MQKLLEYEKVAPDAIRALVGLNTYSDQCSIAPVFRRVLETLVSKINGCSYCIAVHSRQALSLGETQQRLDALDRWSDSDLFSDAEKVALEWASYVTRLDSPDVRDRTFTALREHFSDRQIVDLTFIVLSMNAWNRIGVSFRHEAEGA